MSRRHLALLAASIALAALTRARSQSVDILTAPTASAPQQQAAHMLLQEASARSPQPWHNVSTLDPTHPTVLLALASEVPALLSPADHPQWLTIARTLHPSRAEGYAVASLHHGHLLILAGADPRGQLFAAGWLLRNLPSTGQLPHPAHPFFTAPVQPVRGYQIGYRAKNNTYDAWTLPQFEQQMRDLALFGMNTVQVIAPISDDAPTSPLFHASPTDVVVGLSRLSQQYGLRFDLYYPQMAADYRDPAQVAAELARFEALVRLLPLIDSLHVPGGDPGHTPPEVLFPLLQQEAAILRRYHPAATVWVSGQGFDAARYTTFYQLLAQRPAWLTGVFFGPQSRDSLPTQRAAIPRQYPVEFYPDIAHTMHAQFPVPAWDPIFALTEGREPICPRPLAFTHIVRHYAPFYSGFQLYSEGVNDDVNKVLWAALGWNPHTPPGTILREYARALLHLPDTQLPAAAQAILGLEQNWSQPLLSPRSTIPATHALFAQLHPIGAPDWRFNSLLYRDAYDRYLVLKRTRELAAQTSSLAALDTPTTPTSRAAAARTALSSTTPSPVESALHTLLFTLAATLFNQVGLQLSVPLYHASNWERGANLDRLDTPLNDRAWLEDRITAALASPNPAVALTAIAHYTQPVPDALYDDLGDPTHSPHLIPGTPWTADPELYHAAIDGIADRTLAPDPSPAALPPTSQKPAHPWCLSWLTYAETLYETPLTLRYTHLRPIPYTLRITWAGEDYALPMQITANGKPLQPFQPRTTSPQTLEVPIPAALTQAGTLTIQFTRAPGAGGSGRGGQLAETWLIPTHQQDPTQ